MKRTVAAALGVPALLAATTPAAAHVNYVTDGDAGGSAVALFRAVFTSPADVAVLGTGAIVVGLGVVTYLRFGSLPDVRVARRTLAAYEPYLPWMLRLSVGLPLVGAGFAGYLFSPSVPVEARLLQVAVGFLLLFGLATRLAAAVGLVVYLVALWRYFPTMLLASEYVAGFLAIIAVGAGQPSADMLLYRLSVTDETVVSRVQGITTPEHLLSAAGVGKPTAPILLRLFLGANFLYLGVTQKWLQPDRAAMVVEKYGLTALVPVSPELWIFGAGLVEAAVGLALLSGTFTRGAAATGFLALTTTLFGLPDDPVLAHITLFGLSSAVMVTGSGRYALDSSVVPRLRRRFDPRATAEATD